MPDARRRSARRAAPRALPPRAFACTAQRRCHCGVPRVVPTYQRPSDRRGAAGGAAAAARDPVPASGRAATVSARLPRHGGRASGRAVGGWHLQAASRSLRGSVAAVGCRVTPPLQTLPSLIRARSTAPRPPVPSASPPLVSRSAVIRIVPIRAPLALAFKHASKGEDHLGQSLGRRPSQNFNILAG
jgi:hypothetical protein